MALFKCKCCGGDLAIEDNSTVATCEYCGTKQPIPAIRDENLQNLFNRANVLRMKSEFDKAAEVYERIIQTEEGEAEAYWGLILCRYGIEYVEDPETMHRIPTCHRASFESITADDDYKSALHYADLLQRRLYEEEAKKIDEIQKGILALAQKDEPYDVFICYKESDESGRRTQDSVIANDIYYQLTQEGFKVFYAAITLEDKLGSEYEPHIFAALNTAKVMLALGTKPEYFNAVWVRNEWSRFLAMMKKDRSKTLIPCYRDMDPYELPEEFSHLQAQDMSKIGFINDLARGIKKVLHKDEPNPVKETVVVQQGAAGANVTAQLKRGKMALEDAEWDKADGFFEEVLNQDAENAEAYLGKLMADLRVHRQEELKDCEDPFDENKNYQKTLRFCTPELAKELKGYNQHIKDRNEETRKETIYRAAKDDAKAGTKRGYSDAAFHLRRIPGYKDADALAKKYAEQAEICRKNDIYDNACRLMKNGSIANLQQAISDFKKIPGWKDADQKIPECEAGIKDMEAQIAELNRKAEEVLEQQRIAAEKKAEEDRLEKERLAARQKKNRIVAGIVAAAIVLGIAAFFLTTKVIIPGNKYNAAVELMNEGKYPEAIEAFRAMDGYKDSKDQIIACGLGMMDDGQFDEAIKVFKSMNGYGGCEKYIDDCETGKLEEKYQYAKEVMNSGNYSEAAASFWLICEYKDSEELFEKCSAEEARAKLDRAVSQMDEGNYEDAYKILNAAESDIENASDYISDEERANISLLKGKCFAIPQLETIKDSAVGDTVVFGKDHTYFKNDVLEWIVLEIDGDHVLLLSKNIVSERENSYGDHFFPAWAGGRLREYLNDSFINKEFNEYQQELILTTTIPGVVISGDHKSKDIEDKVFLLSVEEAEQYFATDEERAAEMPEEGESAGKWWLRTDGEDMGLVFVWGSGRIDKKGASQTSSFGLRPAIWITLAP